jgi:hypothetical protein
MFWDKQRSTDIWYFWQCSGTSRQRIGVQRIEGISSNVLAQESLTDRTGHTSSNVLAQERLTDRRGRTSSNVLAQERLTNRTGSYF